MTAQPLISIVMCFLNEERFIEEAIQSVLQQTYKNWELLLVDDGSTDQSSVIARQYASRFPAKICYKEHEGHANKGTSISRNLALRWASGELITFLDGDDVLLPDMLQHLLGILQQQKVSAVMEASKYWHSWQPTDKQDYIEYIGVPQDRIYEPLELNTRLYPLGKGMAPCICGFLISKEVLLAIGGFDEAFEGMYEDQTLLTKLYLRERIYISSGCHNWYRQNQGSLVDASRQSGRYVHERKRFLLWLENYLKKEGIRNFPIQFLLYKAWLPYRYPMQHLLLNEGPRKVKRLFQKLLLKTS